MKGKGKATRIPIVRRRLKEPSEKKTIGRGMREALQMKKKGGGGRITRRKEGDPSQKH